MNNMLFNNTTHPELSVYYLGYTIIKELKQLPNQLIDDVFQKVKAEKNISFTLFMLSLDWLYLVDIATVNKKGVIELCS